MTPFYTGRYNTFLIFGAPGSGKGTQGKVLGTLPRFYHLACGDVFRSLDTRTAIGQQFVKHSSQGELVPDDLTIRLWKSHIENEEQTHDFKPDIDFLILDGIPRNLDQAKIMEQHIHVHRVFHLRMEDRLELTRRLRKRAIKENRFDDATDSVIERRLETYEQETRPMLDFYSDALVSEIDASQAPAKVLLDILAAITSLEVWKNAPRA